jgi:hypothetical protein
MASQKQRRAAKKNIKKAIKAAKRKQTLKHPARLSASKPPKSDNHESSISICTTEPPRSPSSQSKT